MPYIHIRITDEGVNDSQKAQLIAGATQLMVDILSKQPATTHVVIEEVPLANWAWAACRSSVTAKRAALRRATR